MRDEEFDLVSVSDLNRARETWDLISEAQGNKYTYKNKLLKIDARLRERKFGIYEGVTYEEFIEIAKVENPDVENIFEQTRDFKPEGGENTDELLLRAESYL